MLLMLSSALQGWANLGEVGRLATFTWKSHWRIAWQQGGYPMVGWLKLASTHWWGFPCLQHAKVAAPGWAALEAWTQLV